MIEEQFGLNETTRITEMFLKQGACEIEALLASSRDLRRGTRMGSWIMIRESREVGYCNAESRGQKRRYA